MPGHSGFPTPSHTRTRVLTTVLAAALVAAPAAAVSADPLTPDSHVPLEAAVQGADRLHGPNRYATAARVADGWASGTKLVFVASGDTFPDALSAASLAGARNAPVLLTKPDSIPGETAATLERLEPEKVVVVGGEDAISGQVMSQLRDHSKTVQRISGGNRYATAAAVAEEYGTNVDRVYLASGESFPDALAGAALAGHMDAPLLLTSRTRLNNDTAAALQELNPQDVVVLGGSAAVSDDTAEAAAATTRSGDFTRLSGANRYETSAAVAAAFPGSEVPVYLAAGTDFADALVGAARAGRDGAPLVLTPTDSVAAGTRAALQELDVTSMYILGGTSAISASNATNLVQVATGEGVLPDRVFASDSFWYQELPDNTPLDPQSEAMVPWLKQVGIEAWGNEERGLPSMTINTNHYTPTIYATDSSDPAVTVRWNDCHGQGKQHPGLVKAFQDVRIPADAVPGGGSDGHMTLYDTTTDRYTDLWLAQKSGGEWSACWGGSIEGASSSPGYFPAPFGAAASGLPMEPGAIKADELTNGEINHALALSVPVPAVNPTISWPAQRTDGQSTEPLALSEGQRLRLPASLDLDSLNLNPTTRTVAEAAQRYGIVVIDRSGAFTFHAESPLAMDSDPYPELFGGLENYSVLWGDPGADEDSFPFEELEVLPVDYGL